jgi:predicted helicase
MYSMDDEAVYGPEFHHLGFGKAVEMGHLADYKVLVLAVDEEAVSKSFQGLFEANGDLKLDDAARIVGCWNGLSKRGVNGRRLDITDESPMRRAVAFARNIKESKKLAADFELVGRQLLVNRGETEAPALKLEADHVDGTFNVLERSAKLDWLKADDTGTADADTCRILTNARCLSEGVDVPSLDAVLFLNPRNSQVDVVQSVGRVMRTSTETNKEHGYIILPIAVPASQDPETALNDNKKYKVVWDVLQALRAHDDRFEAMINKLELNRNANNKIDVITEETTTAAERATRLCSTWPMPTSGATPSSPAWSARSATGATGNPGQRTSRRSPTGTCSGSGPSWTAKTTGHGKNSASSCRASEGT